MAVQAIIGWLVRPLVYFPHWSLHFSYLLRSVPEWVWPILALGIIVVAALFAICVYLKKGRNEGRFEELELGALEQQIDDSIPAQENPYEELH